MSFVIRDLRFVTNRQWCGAMECEGKPLWAVFLRGYRAQTWTVVCIKCVRNVGLAHRMSVAASHGRVPGAWQIARVRSVDGRRAAELRPGETPLEGMRGTIPKLLEGLEADLGRRMRALCREWDKSEDWPSAADFLDHAMHIYASVYPWRTKHLSASRSLGNG